MLATPDESLPSQDKISELPKNAPDLVASQHQRVDEWAALEEWDIAQEYLNGRLGVFICLDKNPFTFAKNKPSGIICPFVKLVVAKTDNISAFIGDFQVVDTGRASDKRQSPVLIDTIEFMQSVEYIPSTSWICREGHKEFLRVTSGCFYSLTKGLIFDLIGHTHARRERSIGVLLTAIEPNQFPCRVIQGASQVMDSIPRDNGDVGREALAEFNISFQDTIRVKLGAKNICVSLNVGIEGTSQIADVMIGPPDFQEGTFKHAYRPPSHEVLLKHEEETENQEGCGDTHSEAGRLLQESEESRHAVTGQRNQEVTAETAPSHHRGGYTATHTRLGNPEDAS